MSIDDILGLLDDAFVMPRSDELGAEPEVSAKIFRENFERLFRT